MQLTTDIYQRIARAKVFLLILGAGVMTTNDCHATYEELKAKGVQFKSEPR